MVELDFVRIGRRIRERRRSQGLTQEYVAEKLDINPSHISNIECGRANPSLTCLVRIAEVLRCKVDIFLEAEYNYMTDDNPKKSSLSLCEEIVEKLKTCDDARKEKILKIMDII
ncbi:MAG: helix-turn-helix transcriptional regulator [Lachnospiraceae bacterium]|nr:helix-turn-helix transcriptional regulator [Lachnospiraceae bacterium]